MRGDQSSSAAGAAVDEKRRRVERLGPERERTCTV
jgi:hypothetical protein